MLVTVFGGGGFIGRHIVQRLAAAGHSIRIAGRDTERAARLCTMGGVGQITPVAASVTDEASSARAVAGADIVINLVGILFESRAGDFQRIQAEGAGRVARLAAAAGAKQFLHLSAIGADAGSPSLYAQTKAAGEAAVLAAFPGAIILRPSVVFGAEDQFFNRFAGLAALLPFMPVVAGETRFQPVYVGDVADAAMAALADPAAAGKVFELGGPRVMSMRQVLRYILDVTGRQRPMIALPEGFVRLQARLGELLPTPPLTRDQLILLGKDNVVSPNALGFQALGIEPKAVEAIVPSYLSRFRVGGQRVMAPS
ncbi:MAG: complex I NDUFA9 subunit family protein [Roseomonas sp.]|nr:complex I NDUFA9 subunit family protein [Roseomonas sp.]MCA3327112.1 complex I NDUFA9 subunit family protein [Roseomonas sp.]MCA3331024.1 complex I NDUFA9 subunit family protein [Roseomonas sp.]MCA3334108.1 complex I NDUFA9 subunit family protein [Roseomonas sp.]MCA3354379.1 complex I NDUFA9 subunit family protein [Roseomonas sp.]